MAGFIGWREHLSILLATDNSLVHLLGLTHKEIADGIDRFIKAEIDNNRTHRRNRLEFNGFSYSAEVLKTRSAQRSPFGDELGSDTSYKITNESNGESVVFTNATPEFIRRYGFYQGRNSPFRTDPYQITKVFPFLKKPR